MHRFPGDGVSSRNRAADELGERRALHSALEYTTRLRDTQARASPTGVRSSRPVLLNSAANAFHLTAVLFSATIRVVTTGSNAALSVRRGGAPGEMLSLKDVFWQTRRVRVWP